MAHAVPSFFCLVFLAKDLALALDALFAMNALHSRQLFFLYLYESL